MSDGTDFQLETLAVMLAKVDKRLKWAALVLAVALVILAVDLQLKRSLASMAVKAADALGTARLMADLTGRDRERKPDRSRPADAAPAGAGGLVGDAPVATEPDHPGSPAEDATAGLPSSPRKRPPRNGTRASRGTAGTSGL